MSARIGVKASPEMEHRLRDELMRKKMGLGHVEFETWAASAEPSSNGEAM